MSGDHAKPGEVDLEALLDAFEFVSASPGENQAFICRDTGAIYWLSDVVGELEDVELPDDLETSDKYIAVPDRSGFRLGRDLVLSFVAREMAGDLDTVRDIFRRKGAYPRFRRLLASRDKLAKWHAFEEEANKEALRDWCGEVGLRCKGSESA